jgi:hypothetical protein
VKGENGNSKCDIPCRIASQTNTCRVEYWTPFRQRPNSIRQLRNCGNEGTGPSESGCSKLALLQQQ